jgi:hypothetical protein
MSAVVGSEFSNDRPHMVIVKLERTRPRGPYDRKIDPSPRLAWTFFEDMLDPRSINSLAEFPSLAVRLFRRRYTRPGISIVVLAIEERDRFWVNQ